MKKIMFNDKYGLTRAVLEGRKTQTRRIAKIKDIVPNICHFPRTYPHAKYKIGEEVAVAQAYKNIESELPVQISDNEFEQKQAYHIYGDIAGWSNKMFVRADLMPHRIKITNIRVEMLQDISNDDCLKEGIGRRGDTPLEFFVYGEDDVLHDTPQRAFSALIDNVSGKGTWESNPYVFVYDFELIR